MADSTTTSLFPADPLSTTTSFFLPAEPTTPTSEFPLFTTTTPTPLSLTTTTFFQPPPPITVPTAIPPPAFIPPISAPAPFPTTSPAPPPPPSSYYNKYAAGPVLQVEATILITVTVLIVLTILVVPFVMYRLRAKHNSAEAGLRRWNTGGQHSRRGSVASGYALSRRGSNASAGLAMARRRSSREVNGRKEEEKEGGGGVLGWVRKGLVKLSLGNTESSHVRHGNRNGNGDVEEGGVPPVPPIPKDLKEEYYNISKEGPGPSASSSVTNAKNAMRGRDSIVVQVEVNLD
ncbi:hypothetical protein HDV05_008053 [Chytridiales sp. JEL 0842]|nr:hypothetical protein HDV05_008053 [Chytridiales sp. JEL 0842]